MKKTLEAAIKDRRSYYQISNQSPISDEEIQRTLAHVLQWAPSAFNSQSARMLLLLGEHHKKLWELVKVELKKVSISEEAFRKTEEKVNNSFLAGYGTVLFFEDMNVIKNLQDRFPIYAKNFDVWKEQSSAIVQILTWMALESWGLGASLQHYNPLIDNAVKEEWNVDESWHLIAQMPFGTPAGMPKEKTHEPIDARLKVFR